VANNKATSRLEVPLDQLHPTLSRYSAKIHRDVSTEKAHVYFSAPIQQWIAVVAKGQKAILTFHAECPCSKVLNGLVPWSK
jgi:hypothetical protein